MRDADQVSAQATQCHRVVRVHQQLVGMNVQVGCDLVNRIARILLLPSQHEAHAGFVPVKIAD